MSPSVPRLLCLDITKRWTRDPTIWSPQKLLAGDASFFPASLSLSVKRSLTSRFFMYEENAGMKLKDENGPTQVVQLSPSELADILNEQPVDDAAGNNRMVHQHHYCTFPVENTAPGLLSQIKDYEKLHDDHRLLDPRGPSLWMGSSGSGTQAHYDVADNVICQLFGTKRIRCYSPKAASALHVFPDAHPRARKSQVNFDNPDHTLFSNFSSLPPPEIDVELGPGSALFIPAFWFHHVENGIVEKNGSPLQLGDPGPSISLNLFALSKSMMVAQNIFRDASRPFKSATEPHFEFAVTALHALSWKLFKGLNVEYEPSKFIQKHLLDTRYAPLRNETLKHSGNYTRGRERLRMRSKLTVEEEEIISNCIARILPHFASLCEEDDDDGILPLVVCHLFELWAVELVGASSVAEVWEAVLLLDV
jgi:hypothetical protein